MRPIRFLLVLLLALAASGCEAIASIFQAGMWVGVLGSFRSWGHRFHRVEGRRMIGIVTSSCCVWSSPRFLIQMDTQKAGELIWGRS